MTDLPKSGEVYEYYSGTPKPKVTIIGVMPDSSRSGKMVVVFAQHGTLGGALECTTLEIFTQYMTSARRQRYTRTLEAETLLSCYTVGDLKAWLAKSPDSAMLLSVTGVRKISDTARALCMSPECPSYGDESACAVCEFHKTVLPKAVA